MKKNYTFICIMLLFFIQLTFAQISNIDFKDSSYSYGLKPTNISSTDIYDVYVSWRNSFVTTCANNRYRVKFDNPNETVSEGIAYGMLLSVYANDKEVFDGLWLYYQDFVNQNQVMNWKINGCSGIIGQNGATDAELDAAYALIVADERWQSSGLIDYKANALSLIQIIKNHEIENGTNVLKPGDAWGGSNTTNPSYFSPGYFRAFGIFSNDETFWNTVADKSYDILNANLSQNNASYNLVSDWCKADGTYSNEVSWAYNSGKSYYYDAARTPWRMAVDYVWYANSDALAYNQLCIDFVNSKGGFNQIYPGYNQNGTPINTSYKDPTFTGAYATAAMSSTNQNFVNSGYAELKNQVTTAYFGATLRALYMFALSGNMYDALKQNSLSINNTTDNTKFKIYPNPVSYHLYINFETSIERTLKLYSINGRQLLAKKVTASQTQLNVSKIENGIYFLSIDGNTFKIIKS